MKHILYYFIVVTTRIAYFVLKLAGYNATAAPGLIIEKFLPSTMAFMAKKYKHVILITGTNGKTTTQSILIQILKANKVCVLSNASGSNLYRGIATVLAKDFFNTNKNFLILEVEEATMPKITSQIEPNVIVVTNIFRDQLDAYGEITRTLKFIEDSLKNCNTTKLVLNADDPMLNNLIQANWNNCALVSLGSYANGVSYEGQIVKKGIHTNILEVKELLVNGLNGIEFVASNVGKSSIEELKCKSKLVGRHNCYNICFAIQTLKLCSYHNSSILYGISKVEPHFGRGEALSVYAGKSKLNIKLFLVKNPAGFAEIWNLIPTSKFNAIIFALNDNIADGRDISWIWDIKISTSDLPPTVLAFTAGERCLDAALRFKYSGINVVETLNLKDFPQQMAKFFTQDSEVIILATYTALNTIRKSLKSYINIKEYES